MFNWLYDDRTQCWSVLGTMTIGEYIDLVKSAHAERGALSGQRDVLKTTTAKRIRDRMILDIKKGAILPPLVIGAVVGEEQLKKFPLLPQKSPADFLPEKAELSIIDGMQRTAALMEAANEDNKVRDRKARVEFWLAPAVRAMIYRMLVLNTGQVPWTLNRQLSVVYTPLLKEIREKVANIDRIFSPDKPGRRVGPAQFASEDLVELYIAFSLRKTAIDTKEALSEEFSRLDFMENLSDAQFQEQFYMTISILVDLDNVFARYDATGSNRFSKGRNIFDAQPARIGFIVAVAQHILGRPGLDHTPEERKARMEAVHLEARKLIEQLGGWSTDKIGDFLKLDVLSEILDKRVGQVGRYERAVFLDAFKVLVDEHFAVPNMEPCWRAS